MQARKAQIQSAGGHKQSLQSPAMIPQYQNAAEALQLLSPRLLLEKVCQGAPNEVALVPEVHRGALPLSQVNDKPLRACVCLVDKNIGGITPSHPISAWRAGSQEGVILLRSNGLLGEMALIAQGELDRHVPMLISLENGNQTLAA